MKIRHYVSAPFSLFCSTTHRTKMAQHLFLIYIMKTYLGALIQTKNAEYDDFS